MKRTQRSIILAAFLAVIVLISSQAVWLTYAAHQENRRQENNFQSNFKESIAKLIVSRWKSDKSNDYYEIKPVNDKELQKYKEKGDVREINAGDSKDDRNISDGIENALITMSITENKFKTQLLDSILTSLINKESKVVSSHIVLIDKKKNVKLDETRNEYYASPAVNFFVKTYRAERKVEIPDHSYIISAKYTLNPPTYLQHMGWLMVASLLSSLVILGVVFFFLLNIRKRQKEADNMERSFHGAIHDLKSPLAYVFFQLSSMEDDETDMNKKASLSLSASRVTYLTDKIKRLLKSARDIQKIKDVDKEDASLYDMLEQIEAEMYAMFPEKTIRFEHKVDADFTLKVLPDLMEAAIRIIIENAVKYNGSEPCIKITAIRNVNDVKIFISDNGRGMNKGQMKNIFKPYYSSDKKEGNGIGLYYAQRIVNAHGGTISVTSETGEGSTFTITLPNL